MVEDDRAKQEGICGVTFIGGSGIEWICIEKVHAEIYYRKSSDRTHRKGALIYSEGFRADQHYFVNRWPNRNKEK